MLYNVGAIVSLVYATYRTMCLVAISGEIIGDMGLSEDELYESKMDFPKYVLLSLVGIGNAMCFAYGLVVNSNDWHSGIYLFTLQLFIVITVYITVSTLKNKST